MWHQKLTSIKSLGQTTDRPGSLAGLSEARKKHLSQFFTPQHVAAACWDIISNLPQVLETEKLNLFDNSIGIGSMMWNADPLKHRIIGFDIHGPSVDALTECLDAAEFCFDVIKGGLDTCHPSSKVHVSLINPPFSIHLESPALEPFKCTTYGKYGPNTSAISHRYALEQSLNYAQVTIAVLPGGFVHELIDSNNDRLRAIYWLPKNAFADQGVHWETAICVFSKEGAASSWIEERLDADYQINCFPEINKWWSLSENPGIRNKKVAEGVVTIPLPFTGDKRVRITHNGRRLKVHYNCGLMMAKIENALMKKRASANKNQRLPTGVLFSGQAVLDAEVHLAQPDPLQSFETNLVDKISALGAVVKVEKGVREYIRRKAIQLKRIQVPFGLTVLSDGNEQKEIVEATANCNILVDPSSLISPIIEKGEKVDLHNKSGQFYYRCDQGDFLIDEQRLQNDFEVTSGQEQWVVKHKGKAHAFPKIAQMYRSRIKKHGIDQWLSRDFAIDDLIELMIQPCGSICAWEMGLGKTWLICALIQLSEVRHGLIVLLPHLIGEFLRQIQTDLADHISMDDVNVIESPKDLKKLKKFNFISSLRLNVLVDKKQSKVATYAHKLRRRCSLVICDEGHFASNYETGQSKGLRRLSPKKMMIMSGTVIANYPRNIHPLLCLTGSDGTAAQPWGYYQAKLEPSFINTMNNAYTGPKAFKDAFVQTIWASYEWIDGMMKGAKKEIPNIANIALYRGMVAGYVKRRVRAEPEVKKYIQIPDHEIKLEYLDWDLNHLAHYLKVSRKFAEMWLKAQEDKKPLAAILPKIQAVIKAANCPHVPVGGIGAFYGTTPKERRSTELMNRWKKEKAKALVFVSSPKSAERLNDHFNKEGIKSIVMHGGVSIKRRRQLIEQFKTDQTVALIATVGTLSAGENLACASKTLHVDAQWSHKTEAQCYSRTLRPDQTESVESVFLHYDGGICSYMRQLVSMKEDAAKVGIDFASPECLDDFIHMEQLLNNFVHGLPEMEQKLLDQLAA